MAVTECLRLESYTARGSEFVINYILDKQEFSLRFSYQQVDFDLLRRDIGGPKMDRLLAVIAFIFGLNFCSLAPAVYDVSKYSQYIDVDLKTLFSHLYNGIFAQHRFENQLFDYKGPQILGQAHSSLDPYTFHASDIGPEVLMSSSVGKDSLVAMKLLERMEVPFSSYNMRFVLWGEDSERSQLDRLLDVCDPIRRHVVEGSDIGLRELIDQKYSKIIKTICSPATPNAVFLALPVMLQHGYRYLVVGNEMSADTPNFFSKELDQQVNHQWGKSLDAEKLIEGYISKNLISSFSFFSILKPFSEYTIFSLLRNDQQYFYLTHSCNLLSTWCRRCPKCVYVWLQSLAYLDESVVSQVFEENLFEVTDVEDILLELIGLNGNKPFECVGDIEESQLAFVVCMEKGYDGPVLQQFRKALLPQINVPNLRERYSLLLNPAHNIPQRFLFRLQGIIKSL